VQNAIVNVNGQIISSAEAKVSVFDRSYLYGDSLYEVVRTYDGKYFGVDEHLERLEASAKLCHMNLAQDRKTFVREIERTHQAFNDAFNGAAFRNQHKNTEAYCRIIVSRGVGKIGFGLNCLTTPTQYTIIVQPLELPSQEQYERGYKLKVVDRLRNDKRALDPAMKSGNYLNSLLGYLEATSSPLPGNSAKSALLWKLDSFNDALLANADGHITEGTTFNIGYIKRGIFVTPPLDIGILDGITRRFLIKMAREMGMEVREVRFPKERLYEADEVFWMSSIREAFPVTQVDEHVIGTGNHKGKPGQITQKLSQTFKDFASGRTSIRTAS
jgi:branched-chain amino acid aminotransferase